MTYLTRGAVLSILTMMLSLLSCTENAKKPAKRDGGPDSGATRDTATELEADAGTDLFEVSVALASDISPSAPGTVGIVTWSIEGAVTVRSASIELGLDTGYGMTAPVDLGEPDFRTLLLGMKPDKTYHFRIIATDGAATYTSKDYTVKTGPPTNLISLRRFNVIDESSRERGFIIASFWEGPGSATAFIIDSDGDIVWWYETDLAGICRARMSADAKNMWMVVPDNGGGFLERVTMDTLSYEIYSVGASHDVTPVRGDKMAYIDFSESDCNSIFEIDPSGETVEVFEAEGIVTGRCHGNALRYSYTEDVYTFSNLNTDVLVISPSGELQWRLSDLVGSNAAWGGRQHGHHLLDESIVIFANEAGGNSSAVIEYDLDGNEILYYDSGLYTSHLGDVQRLPGGNTLVSYSDDAPFLHEIDPQGNLVLEIDTSTPDGKSPRALGYPLWVKNLYDTPSDLLL